MQSELLKTIEERINDLLKAEETTVEEYKKHIETAEKAEENATKEYTKAFNDCDEKAYQKAMQAQRSASDIKEMYKKRLENQNKNPLISEEEYNHTVSAIIKEMNTLNAKGAKRFLEMFEEMREIADEVTNTINSANKILNTLQHVIYKDDAMITLANGIKIHSDASEKKYTHYPLNIFLKSIVSENGSKNILYDELGKYAEILETDADQEA